MLVANIFSVLHIDCILLLLGQLPLGALAVLFRATLSVQIELIPCVGLHLKAVKILNTSREMMSVVQLVSWRSRVLTNFSLHFLTWISRLDYFKDRVVYISA